MIGLFELWGSAWVWDPLAVCAVFVGLGNSVGILVTRGRLLGADVLVCFGSAGLFAAAARLSSRLSTLGMGGDLRPWMELGSTDYVLCSGIVVAIMFEVAHRHHAWFARSRTAAEEPERGP